jgi:hypothetical protein
VDLLYTEEGYHIVVRSLLDHHIVCHDGVGIVETESEVLRSLVYIGEVLGYLDIGSLFVIIDFDFTIRVSHHHSRDYWVTPLDSQHSIGKLVELLHLVVSHQVSQCLYVSNVVELCC